MPRAVGIHRRHEQRLRTADADHLSGSRLKPEVERIGMKRHGGPRRDRAAARFKHRALHHRVQPCGRQQVRLHLNRIAARAILVQPVAIEAPELSRKLLFHIAEVISLPRLRLEVRGPVDDFGLSRQTARRLAEQVLGGQLDRERFARPDRLGQPRQLDADLRRHKGLQHDLALPQRRPVPRHLQLEVIGARGQVLGQGHLRHRRAQRIGHQRIGLEGAAVRLDHVQHHRERRGRRAVPRAQQRLHEGGLAVAVEVAVAHHKRLARLGLQVVAAGVDRLLHLGSAGESEKREVLPVGRLRHQQEGLAFSRRVAQPHQALLVADPLRQQEVVAAVKLDLALRRRLARAQRGHPGRHRILLGAHAEADVGHAEQPALRVRVLGLDRQQIYAARGPGKVLVEVEQQAVLPVPGNVHLVGADNRARRQLLRQALVVAGAVPALIALGLAHGELHQVLRQNPRHRAHHQRRVDRLDRHGEPPLRRQVAALHAERDRRPAVRDQNRAPGLLLQLVAVDRAQVRVEDQRVRLAGLERAGQVQALAPPLCRSHRKRHLRRAGDQRPGRFDVRRLREADADLRMAERRGVGLRLGEPELRNHRQQELRRLGRRGVFRGVRPHAKLHAHGDAIPFHRPLGLHHARFPARLPDKAPSQSLALYLERKPFGERLPVDAAAEARLHRQLPLRGERHLLQPRQPQRLGGRRRRRFRRRRRRGGSLF